MPVLLKKEKRKRRHLRVRAKISGTNTVPRLSVFKSNKHIYCQLIDDEKSKTLLSASDLEIKKTKVLKKVSVEKNASAKEVKNKEKEQKALSGKTAIAFEVGRLIAEKAIKNKVKKIVFDRGGFSYHGRIKALAEGARVGGLEF